MEPAFGTLDRKLRALRNTLYLYLYLYLYRYLVGVCRSELPHRTTVARRLRSLPFLRHLQRVLRCPGDLRLIVLDLTDLPIDPRRDPDGRWGHVTKEAFFGRKLHLVVNRRGMAWGPTRRRQAAIGFNPRGSRGGEPLGEERG